MATKIIKFHDSTTTYLPVTDASAVQYNDSGSKISVQTAIDERIKHAAFLCTSTSAASTYTKTATVDAGQPPFPTENGIPKIGTSVIVKYTVTNTYKTAGQTYTLNVNNTGDFPMYYSSAELATSTSANTLVAGYASRYVHYVFNGSQWVFVSASYDTNTTYTNVSLGQGKTTACGTAAATAAKTASLSNYALTTGGIVTVVFTNGNTAANPTLNINSKGAKAIYWKEAACPTDLIKAGDVVTFIYNSSTTASYGGAGYHIISIIRNNEHTYTASGNNLFITGITQDKEGEITNVEYGDLEDLNIPVFEGDDPGLVPEPLTPNEVVKVLGSDGHWKIIEAEQTVNVSYNLQYSVASSHQNVDIQDTTLWGSFGSAVNATDVFVGGIDIYLTNEDYQDTTAR